MQRNSKRSTVSQKFARQRKSQSRARLAPKRFSNLELLENRTLMSTVTTLADAGAGSLRDAILAANSSVGPDTIDFNITGATPGTLQTISLDSELPTLLGDITIDGTGVLSTTGAPLIMIDGSAAAISSSPLSYGLLLQGSNNTVKGIGVAGFSDAQIWLAGAGNHVLTGDWIGVGTDPLAPGLDNVTGVVIDSTGNVIGGATSATRNIISGNGWNGITINVAGNQVLGNYIGLDDTGLSGLLNNNNGIEINGAGNTTISGNVISSNNGYGIVLNNVTATGVLITANIIGLDADGAAALGNLVHGVALFGSSHATISDNTIAGNFSDGINLTGSSFNLIKGNRIGTDITGLLPIGNTASGVRIVSDGSIDSTDNTIGGTTAAARNIISGNFGNGIDIDTVATNNLIQGNYIGTDNTGLVALSNSGNGIYITAGGAIIGGAISGAGNVISGNGNDGILLSSGSVVLGNLIGLGADGLTPIANENGAGILIDGANNTIGGILPGAGNTIAFNNLQGIVVLPGDSNDGNTIRGNSIYSNVGIGIDLENDGVTPNLPGVQTGANNLQNFPVISSAGSLPGSVTVAGSLPASSGSYTIDFYVSPTAHSSGHGQGKYYIGSATVSSVGGYTFNATFSTSHITGVVTATATDANGNTSEFSLAESIVPILVETGPAITTTTVSSSQNPSTYKQSVTFTATVAPTDSSAGTATGFVKFFDGSTELATVLLDSNGQATYSTTNLAVGSHSITAVFQGNDDYITSSSSSLSQVVNKAASTTALTVSPSPTVFGQSVQLTANVSNLIGEIATGTITFSEGSTVLGTVVLDGSGAATLTISSLSVGSHAFTATYSGSGNLKTSADTTSHNVNQAQTSTSVSANVNPSTVGGSITFTANVSVLAPGAGALTGTVSFYDGSNFLGTQTLASGVATLTTSALAVGSHSITAVYDGSTNFVSSASAQLTQQVNQASTTTSIVSNINPSVTGQAVTFTATVGTSASGAGAISGTILFMEGSTVLASVALVGGSASFTTTGLSVGSHNIVAVYGGNTNYAGSSDTAAQNINKGATTTTLTSSVNPSTFGQSVTLTANVGVNAPASGLLSGTVTFTEGSTVLGTVNLTGGSASLVLSSLSAGPHSITATYNGDANFNGSNASLSQTVNQAATSTTLNSSANPSNVGQAVTFTASVSAASGTPTGTVTFKDGSTVLAVVNLVSGSASYTTSALTVGGHTITAIYSGAANYAVSASAPLTQTVNSVPASLSGYVYKDLNNDGVKQPGENGIAGVSVTLSGTNDLGAIAPIVVITDAGGMYIFPNLRPGTYTITQQSHSSAPLNAYVNGKDQLGNQGGSINASGAFVGVTLASGAVGSNYNFGETQNVLSGTTYRDITGNGLTSDDVVMGGVTVRVYRDLNNNGMVDSSDGSPVSTVVSNASTGAYSVLNLAAGDYLVREVVPTGYVRTHPVMSDTYDIAISANSSFTNLNFDNYKACVGTISNVVFSVGSGCNKTTFTDLRGKTQMGQTVTVTFTVSGTSSMLVSFVTYDAPSSTFDANIADQQTIFDIDSQVFGPGQHTLTVTIPTNYYQIDFVKCAAIDKLGPAGSNIFYSAQSRLISADNAGTHSDVDDLSAATGFWAHLGQTLIKSFNVTDDTPNPTALSNWLVSNYPNLYGAGAYNLTGKSNAFVAQTFKSFYNDQARHKTDASVMATALNVYASTLALGGDAGSNYGFEATEDGLGAATFNVGSNGAAFGVSNNSTLSVAQLLFQANARSSGDVLYNGVTSMLAKAYSMFELINNAGAIDA